MKARLRELLAALRAMLDGRTWESPSRNALLGWTGFFALYFAWIAWNHPRQPLLVLANMFLHEAGHPILGMFGETAAVWGGTIFQLAFPVVALVSFFFRQEIAGVAFSLFWLGANVVHVGVYQSDARAGVLPLIGGGEHDWEHIFTQLGVLEQDTLIGGATSIAGWLLMLSAPAVLARYALAKPRTASGAPRTDGRWGSL